VLIEKVWNSDGKRASKTEDPRFVPRSGGNGSRMVGIDAEVCGISLDPETGSLPQARITSDPSLAFSNERALTVANPEIRIARRPGADQDRTGKAMETYFQSQALFYLKDRSGRIPSRIRVQCNRPHFLIGDDLVQFAVQALEHGLKLQSKGAN
jgi:hypothetical protein